MNKCPHCASVRTERVRRAVWMRLFPGMIRVRCRDCRRDVAMFARDPRDPAFRRAIDL